MAFFASDLEIPSAIWAGVIPASACFSAPSGKVSVIWPMIGLLVGLAPTKRPVAIW